jgi:hypothetical protein
MTTAPIRPAVALVPTLPDAWAAERSAARAARISGDTPTEWRHLERAHVLSQPMANWHVRTHLAMLSFGLRQRDGREIVGQLKMTSSRDLGRSYLAASERSGSLDRHFMISSSSGEMFK